MLEKLIPPSSSLLPQFDYYQLPFCKPNRVHDLPENLGEALAGEKARRPRPPRRSRPGSSLPAPRLLAATGSPRLSTVGAGAGAHLVFSGEDEGG